MSKRRVNARGVVWRDGTVLAVRHRDENGVESPYWAIPGGGLDPKESLERAVKRELKEELGVSVEVGNLLFVQQFLSKRTGFDEELEFFFHVKDAPSFDSIDISKTTHGHELSRVAFVDPTTEPILPDILTRLDYDAAIAGAVPVELLDELNV